MRRWILLLILLAGYVVTLGPLCQSMQDRSVAVRLGFLPDATLLKMVSADFQPLVAQLASSRVLFYYGSLVDNRFNRGGDRPEYFQMFKALEKAIKLDPYNQDPYYFAQATFTWELNRAKDVNKLLEYGMRYRPQDYWLPFYVGFNSAYFLNDQAKAARFLQQSAELSGNSRIASLASRLYYLSGRNDLAIPFLETMITTSQNETIRNVYIQRLDAINVLQTIERARDGYLGDHGQFPDTVEQLVQKGYLQAMPIDPYGGVFSFGQNGQVLTSSRLFQQNKIGEPQ